MQSGKLEIVQKREPPQSIGGDGVGEGPSLPPDAPARPSGGSNALRPEYSGFSAIGEWLDRVDKQKAVAETKAQLELRLCEVRVLLSSRQFEPAIRELERLAEEYPQYEIGDLLNRTRQEQLRDAAVVQALEEANWRVEQNRIDLAVQFMREKAGELSGDTRFLSRLEKLEAALPEWENRRSIEECLRHVAALEQRAQWSVALNVLEGSLSVNPASRELLDAAERLRGRLREQESRQRFANRLAAISRKIAARDWRHALALLEAARAEFPGEAELEPLESTAREALRLARYENIASDVRQHIAGGETGEAARVLREALETDPGDPALTALLAEVEEEERYRSELRDAQILFGRRQFAQAESILVRIAVGGRPEAAALLELIEERRVADEEEDFYKRGVDKLSNLIREERIDQAADLLENLISLFPNDPILERRRQAIERGGRTEQTQPGPPPAHAAPEKEGSAELESAAVAEPGALSKAPKFAPLEEARPRRFPWVLSGIGVVVIAGGAFLFWQYSSNLTSTALRPSPFELSAHTAAGAPGKVTGTSATSGDLVIVPPSGGQGANAPAAQQASKAQVGKTAVKTPVSPTRAFEPPQMRSQVQPWDSSGTPAPPAINRTPGSATLPDFIAGSRPATPAPVPPVAAAAPKPQTSELRPAVLISSIRPELPKLASQHGMYGTVALEATITRNGTLTAVKVLSGNPLLVEAAKKAVVQWRYRPATLNGQPIESTREIKVDFERGK